MVARAFSSATFCHSQRSPAACVSNQGGSGFTPQAMALGFSVTFAANPVVAGEERSYHLSWFRGVGPLAASYLCGVVARRLRPGPRKPAMLASDGVPWRWVR